MSEAKSEAKLSRWVTLYPWAGLLLLIAVLRVVLWEHERFFKIVDSEQGIVENLTVIRAKERVAAIPVVPVALHCDAIRRLPGLELPEKRSLFIGGWGVLWRVDNHVLHRCVLPIFRDFRFACAGW